MNDIFFNDLRVNFSHCPIKSCILSFGRTVEKNVK